MKIKITKPLKMFTYIYNQSSLQTICHNKIFAIDLIIQFKKEVY